MSSKCTASKQLRSAEQGMVAIMTTMVLIIVISLIVLGFAQLSRRNQREALDRQLSTQAFYAAETGVNDARKRIDDALASGASIPEKDTCTGSGPAGFYASLNPDIDSDKNVRYTCLLVDPAPSMLRYSDIGTNSTVVPLISSSGDAISRVALSWQAKVDGDPLTGCPVKTDQVFSPTGNWQCGYGVLRFDLVPTAGNKNIASLQNETMTTFAVPFASGGATRVSYAAGGASSNVRTGVRCTGDRCSLEVTGLNQNNYHMRISSLYRNVALQITAYNESGSALGLKDVQAVIDVTGKAQDVLRRIQVHVPLRGSSRNLLADYALQTTDSVCKRFVAMDGYFGNSAASGTGSGRLCQP